MSASAARRASKPDSSVQPREEAPRGRIQVAEDAHGAASSPARALQARLEQDLQAGQAQETRWPLYAALAFWCGASALLWAGIIAGAWMLLRRG